MGFCKEDKKHLREIKEQLYDYQLHKEDSTARCYLFM
jgi:hypothetical protein